MFRKLELKRFGDDQLAELSHARFQEAKKRLRNFVINTDMKSDPKERKRLQAFFKHRPNTLLSIMKDCFKARKGNAGKKMAGADASIEYQQTLNSSEQDI